MARKRKKIVPMKYPVGVEYTYRNLLRSLNHKLKLALKEHLAPIVPKMALEAANIHHLPTGTVRQDAWEDDLRAALQKITNSMIPPTEDTIRAMTAIGPKVDAFNKEEWRQLIRSQYGVNPTAEAPDKYNSLLREWSLKNADLIKDIPDKAMKQIADETTKTLLSGGAASDLSDTIFEILGDRTDVSDSRCDLIARDQIAKLNGNFTQERQTDIGVTHYTWRTVGDERVRETHSEADGNTYSWDEPPDVTEGNHPGEDYQCLLPDSKINVFGRYQHAFRRWYDGPIIQLITNMGTIDATPNHPVLVIGRGWVPISNVNDGDYLVFTRQQSFDAIKSNKQIIEASVSYVFDAFAKLFGVKVRCNLTKSEFHGDITNSKVDVVRTNSFLSGEMNVVANKNIGKLDFAITDPDTADAGFNVSCLDVEVLDRSRNVTDSFISGKGSNFSFRRSEETVFEKFTFGLSSQLNVRLLQDASDDATIDAEQLGNFVNGMIPVESDDFSLIDIDYIVCSPVRVHNVSSREYSGMVYNFSIVNGWYAVNGFILKNCRCWAEPILPEVMEFEASLLEEAA